jgi:hypothetical protein
MLAAASTLQDSTAHLLICLELKCYDSYAIPEASSVFPLVTMRGTSSTSIWPALKLVNMKRLTTYIFLLMLFATEFSYTLLNVR